MPAYPRYTDGAQPRPEEDSGGAYAYAQKLARSRRAKAAAKQRRRNEQGDEKALDARADLQPSRRSTYARDWTRNQFEG
ncbi:hypothetical protein Haur_5162 (plasmid) [Herpetosiphon aurantiacus DSM 785]|uniref:Uncharacterized protein n=1 Tax=Herpetosiphon aurantiacus (strain ATCC 23779 / DSM 785 / 114-95) TaxID=316274 RepID=A9B8X6_HERA2|nr:hypothetical protein Haur_5162 [Herpetosiphon aurantiacus DSM 785]